MKAVEDTFEKMPRETLNKVFLTLQKVHELIILNDGTNKFKLPHMRKEALARRGQLPLSWPVSDELKQKIEQLQQAQQAPQVANINGVGVDV